MTPQTHHDGIRPLARLNKSGETCPAFGCVQIGKHGSDTSADLRGTSHLNTARWREDTEDEEHAHVIHGYKPDRFACAAQEPALFGFNLGVPIPKGKTGYLTQTWPAVALIDSFGNGGKSGTETGGTPNTGDAVGPYTNQWHLAPRGVGAFISQGFTEKRIVTRVADRSSLGSIFVAPATRLPMSTAFLVWPGSGSLAQGATMFNGVWTTFPSGPFSGIEPHPKDLSFSPAASSFVFDNALYLPSRGAYHGTLYVRIRHNGDASVKDDEVGVDFWIVDGPNVNAADPNNETYHTTYYNASPSGGRMLPSFRADSVLVDDGVREIRPYADVTMPFSFYAVQDQMGINLRVVSDSGVGTMAVGSASLVVHHVPAGGTAAADVETS